MRPTQNLSRKELFESLIFSLLTGKKYIEMQTSTTGTGLNHMLLYVLVSSRFVRKSCRCCFEVISRNGGSLVSAANLRLVKTVRVSLIFAIADSKELALEGKVKK